jgi:hypothetical protein
MREGQLTQKQAWKLIKQHYQQYRATGRPPYLAKTGLCRAIWRLNSGYEGTYVPWTVWAAMNAKVEKLAPRKLGYFWPLDRKGALARIKVINKILKRL